MKGVRGLITIVLTGGVVLGLVGFLAVRSDVLLGDVPVEPAGHVREERDRDVEPTPAPSTNAAPSDEMRSPETTTTATTTTLPEREIDTVPSWTVGLPWGSTRGVTMFRGNPTRTFYGTGPLSTDPSERWRYPEAPMCSRSTAGGETKVWCGLGWTGQPAVHERSDGRTELVFGAYDRAVHFLDAETGLELRPRFLTGDIIKGSVTVDPDGFPLVYFGSRDNNLRALALDREHPQVLWSLDANEVQGIWNNDWDGNPVVVDDILYVGGENGWFFAYQLNRAYDDAGMVSIDPRRLVAFPGYDDELLDRSGRNVSIESSVAVFEDRVYFTNSGGRVVGVDISNIRTGEAPIVFDYYTGGDIDATPVIDERGHLYVAIEHEPSQMGTFELEHNRRIGQLVKLDPEAADPHLWGIDLVSGNDDSGIWATPALHEGMLYVNTHNGDLIAVDADDGSIVWTDVVGWHSWSSPVVVDDTLIVPTCTGELRGYALDDPRSPQLSWSIEMGGACLEATPVVWDGTIFLGSRDGYMRAFR